MTISAVVVFKPRRIRTCPMCVKRIQGACFRLYGAAYRGDKPYTMHICKGCAIEAIEPKIKAAVAKLEARAA